MDCRSNLSIQMSMYTPEQVAFLLPLFKKSMFDGTETGLDYLAGSHMSTEAYIEFFQMAMDELLANKFIDNLRYLELAAFLEDHKKSGHNPEWYAARMNELIYGTSSTILPNTKGIEL